MRATRPPTPGRPAAHRAEAMNRAVYTSSTSRTC